MTTLQWAAAATAAIALGLVGSRFLGRDTSTATAVAVHEPAVALAEATPDVEPTAPADSFTPAGAATVATRHVVDEAPRDELPVSRPFVGAVVVECRYPDGEPAAGAELAIFTAPPLGDHERSLLEHERDRARFGDAWPAFPTERAGVEPTRRARADEHGRAYLSAASVYCEVRARGERDGRLHRGFLRLQTNGDLRPAASHGLTLAPAESARARVESADGTPLAGVVVAVIVDSSEPLGWRGNFSARTDADGRVAFEDVADGWARARERGSPVRVRALVPGTAAVEVPLIAEAEVRLVLPPLGSVVVELPESVPPDSIVELGTDDEPSVLRVTAIDGRAVFPHVALGAELRASVVDYPESPTERFAGPRASGETRVHRWATPRDGGVVRVAVVDEGGSPFANRAVRIRWHQRRGTAGGAITNAYPRADADGVLRYGPPLAAGGDSASLSLIAFDDALVEGRRRERRATIDVPDARLAAGRVLDLGAVVLEPAPVLASGRVLDEAGRPVADATVQAVESGTAATANGILDRPTSVTDDDGRFVLFGAPPAARVELVAAAPGRTPIAPLAFEPGTTDLVLTLAAAAHVEATVRTPDGIGMWAFACALEHADGSSSALHVPLAERRASGEATWSRDDVTPGPAALVVRSAVSGDELFRRDVVLAAGERTDLGLVDLTDALPTFELSVQDERGGYVGRFSARYVDAPDVQLLTGLVDPARLPRPHDGATIEVSARGYLPATATVTADRVAVRLRRSTAVALRLPPGFPTPPERSPLHIGFERLSGDDAQGSSPFPRASADNTYRLDLGAPGRFVARVYRTGVGINFLAALAEAEFEVTPEAIENGTPIELPFDLDAWTRALEAER